MCFVRSERSPVATDRRGAVATRRERARGAPCSFPRESGVSRRGGGDPNPPIPSSASSSATLERQRASPAGRAATGAAGREGSHPRRPVRGGGELRPERWMAGGSGSAGNSRKPFIPQEMRRTEAARGTAPGRRRTAAGNSSRGEMRRNPPTFPLFPSPKTLARADLRIKGDDPGVAPAPLRSSQPSFGVRVTDLRVRSGPDGR